MASPVLPGWARELTRVAALVAVLSLVFACGGLSVEYTPTGQVTPSTFTDEDSQWELIGQDGIRAARLVELGSAGVLVAGLV